MIVKSLLFLIINFMFLGCANAQVDESKIYKPETFVKIHAVLSLTSCKENKEANVTECRTAKRGSFGSGNVIKHIKDHTFILTAGHVCTIDIPEVLKDGLVSHKLEFFVNNYRQEVIEAKVHKIAEDFLNGNGNDLCLLKTKKMKGIKPLRLASGPPKPGERLYSMSAPWGVYHPPHVPFLSGLHSGPLKNDNKHHSLISVPAISGSSGSSVMNKHGHVVGVIFAANIRFKHITIMINHESVKKFLDKHLKL